MKRIVLCADGTWDKPGKKSRTTGRYLPTNLLKITRSLAKEDEEGVSQIVYYHKGLGTGNVLDRLVGGIKGDGMDVMIIDLYRFLVYNYEVNDEIYMFGYSRGAFCIRSLCGFLNNHGLLSSEDEHLTPLLYQFYQSKPNLIEDSELHKSAWKTSSKYLNNPLNKNAINRLHFPSISYVGLLDTVSALGLPFKTKIEDNIKQYKYHIVNVNTNIDYVCHALSIDEQRFNFKPVLLKAENLWKLKHFDQCWFSGCHDDIGGGNDIDSTANIVLNWIIDIPSEIGLKFNKSIIKMFSTNEVGPINCHHSSLYSIFSSSKPRLPDLSELYGQSLHPSVLERLRRHDRMYIIDESFLKLPIYKSRFS